MELKEYLHILKKKKSLFVFVIIIVIAAVFSYFLFRPIAYETSLDLNITRSGSQNTEGYKYDDFYRLQADEKFAETLVEWLKTPRIVKDIYAGAGVDREKDSLRSLEKNFRVEKMSSQLVSVTFSEKDRKTAEKISNSLVDEVRANTENLNSGQKENTWFEIVSHEPVIVMRSFSPMIVFLSSLIGGIFLAFWIVMLKHYME
jgi:capsular polysaccharide biosynthesis protein